MAHISRKVATMLDEPSDRLISVFGVLAQAVSDRVRIAIAEAFTRWEEHTSELQSPNTIS